jgi:nicotinate-nucleotide--dimethylbenzimidazole phosphoribosyltransferase
MTSEDAVLALAARIEACDEGAAAAALARHDQLTKPQGSLGALEDLGVRLAGMAGESPPPVPGRPVLIVAAGDHGVLARGVSPWPAEVTVAMVDALCRGTAAANALARVVGADVTVLDVGVAGALPRHPRLRARNIRPGTADLSEGPAMTRDEASRAVLAGAHLVDELAGAGADLLLTGDMGIGNTTAAACLIGAFTGRPAEDVTGRGTGIDDATFDRKRRVVAEALALHAPVPADPLGALACVGGMEHAALAGVILGAAEARLPVVIDGVSACAAALVAAALAPGATGYMVAGHRSVEPGAAVALRHLGLTPLLDLQMRLGEGTGALLAVPIVRSAAAALAQMQTFEEAGLAGAAAAAEEGRAGTPA